MLAHSAAVALKEIILSGTKVLIACNAALISVENSYVYEGVVNMPKATGVTFAPGEKCYWDNSAKNITSVSGGNTLCGICLKDSLTADTTIEMFLRQYNTEVTDATADSKAASAGAQASTNLVRANSQDTSQGLLVSKLNSSAKSAAWSGY